MTDHSETIAKLQDKTLIIVDDDKPFLSRLGRAMESRGFDVIIADTVTEGIAHVKKAPPAFAVVDMRLEDGNGLDVIKSLNQARPEARAIVLTGYGNIATAVTAVKLGAIDYLAKPADADDVLNALLANPQDKADPPENPMSADRVRWEHIQRVYELCGRNVSAGPRSDRSQRPASRSRAASKVLPRAPDHAMTLPLVVSRISSVGRATAL